MINKIDFKFIYLQVIIYSNKVHIFKRCILPTYVIQKSNILEKINNNKNHLQTNI